MTFELSRELQERLDATLSTLLNVTGDTANLQLFDPHTHSLKIVSQFGFKSDFIAFFGEVRDQHSACAAALRRGEQVTVENVATDPIFRGTEARTVMLNAGSRSVQSTPLTGSHRQPLGVISSHYGKPRHFSRREMIFIDEVATQAARSIEHTSLASGPFCGDENAYSLFWDATRFVSFIGSIHGLENSIQRLKELSSQTRGRFVLFGRTNLVATSKNGIIEVNDEIEMPASSLHPAPSSTQKLHRIPARA